MFSLVEHSKWFNVSQLNSKLHSIWILYGLLLWNKWYSCCYRCMITQKLFSTPQNAGACVCARANPCAHLYRLVRDFCNRTCIQSITHWTIIPRNKRATTKTKTMPYNGILYCEHFCQHFCKYCISGYKVSTAGGFIIFGAWAVSAWLWIR